IDHMAAEVANHRLFVAALGNNSVEIIDLSSNKRIKSIDGLREPQGIAFINDRQQIAVACGEDGKCRFFDADSFESRGYIGFDSDADNVRYNAAESRLYVGYGRGAIGIVNPIKQQRVGQVSLSGHPESFQLETKGPRIFVNVPDAQQVTIVDRATAKITGSWRLDGSKANFPMTLDETGRRLFVGCRAPAEILIFNIDAGKLVARFPSVGDMDDIFFDMRTKRIYACGGEGYVYVHERRTADKFERIAKISTAAGARTGLFVPEIAQLFV